MSHASLPYVTRVTALCPTRHCPISHASLPYVTRVTALCHTRHCPMSHASLPYVTRVTALCHTRHCPMSHASLPYVTRVTALCYVMLWCPFNTPAMALGVGGGGFHGISSVGGGAQPLKQQSGAFQCNRVLYIFKPMGEHHVALGQIKR
jgi:hypothetical protein